VVQLQEGLGAILGFSLRVSGQQDHLLFVCSIQGAIEERLWTTKLSRRSLPSLCWCYFSRCSIRLESHAETASRLGAPRTVSAPGCR
jgi:hypothetical protein